MIIFRKNPLSSTEEIIENNIEGKSLRQVFYEVMESQNIPENAYRCYQVSVNGLDYDDEESFKWVVLKEEDEIRISVVAKGSNSSRGLFKTLALIAVAVTATALTGGWAAAGYGGWASAVVATSVMAASFALNKLLPPIIASSSIGGNNADSQVYSLTGQSNGMKPFGLVPKVYGNHRIFPNIVGTPYITLEADSAGKNSQFLTAIYDLGHGPMQINNLIEDVFIGETPLKNFSEYMVRLVDLNMPVGSAEYWDRMCFNSFTLYKGDVSTEEGAYTFTTTFEKSGYVETAGNTITRSWPSNSDLVNQELSIALVFPRGLYCVASNGTKSNAEARVNIQIATETGPWRDINDTSFISSYSITAGTKVQAKCGLIITGGEFGGITLSKKYTTAKYRLSEIAKYYYLPNHSSYSWAITTTMVVSETTRYVYIPQTFSVAWLYNSDGVTRSPHPNVGDYVIFQGINLGKVSAIVEGLLSVNVTLATAYNKWIPFDRRYGDFTGDNDFTLNTPRVSPYTEDTNVYSDNRAAQIYFSSNTYEPVYGEVRLIPKVPGDYRFRLTYYNNTFPSTYQTEATLALVSYSQRLEKQPIITNKRHLFLELKIKATNQLNGNIQNLSANVTSVLDYYNTVTSSWKKKPTSNPAWIYVDLLTGQINKRAIDKSRLHLPSILEWAAFCDVLPSEYLEDTRTCRIVYSYTGSPTPGYDAYRLEDKGGGGIPYTSEDSWFFNTGSEWVRFYFKYPLPATNFYIIEIAKRTVKFPSADYTVKLVREYTRPRYESNFILDYESTLINMINSVTNSYQASYSIIDGLYGVLIDKRRTTPVQIFTPRNSWGTNISRQYIEQPHGLKIKYIDPFSNWEQREQIVYREGFDKFTALTFEEVTSFGVTNHEQAFRFGRYVLAQNTLRKETYTLNVDFEHLVCTRGDFVQISNDVMLSGGTPARVKDIVSTTLKQIVVDEDITFDPLKSYGVVTRNIAGISQTTITVVDEKTFTVPLSTTISVGDLVIVGEMGFIVYDCIVKTIQPNEDLTATLTLVERADAIHDAETNALLPGYDPKLTKALTDEIAPPAVENLRVVDNYWECTGSGYRYFIDLAWDIPLGAYYSSYEIYIGNGNGLAFHTITNSTTFNYEITNLSLLDTPHYFKVLGLNSYGAKIDLSSAMEASATPLKKTTRPSSIVDLNVNITSEVLQLAWTRITDCDCNEYLIRYSPLTTGALWEASIPLLRVDRNTSMVSFQARTGSYFIKAVDFNLNESLTPAKAITSIPELFNLHFIEEITDAPLWNGGKSNTVLNLGSIMLKESVSGTPENVQYYSEGYYYYREIIDLGSIFTLRIESNILAEGYTPEDMMSNWTTLADLEVMSGSRYSDWDVELQVRSTDRFDIIADWTHLSDVNAMSEGTSEKWTEWRKLSSISEFTGRIFQFRLKLISNKSNITPRVYIGAIRAHMPTRIESFENVICPIGGMRIYYGKDFFGPDPSPAVQISQDSAVTGDTYAITFKDLSGFDIEFFDNTGASISRQFDATIKGYGYKYTEVI